jgi:hypothetical protein
VRRRLTRRNAAAAITRSSSPPSARNRAALRQKKGAAPTRCDRRLGSAGQSTSKIITTSERVREGAHDGGAPSSCYAAILLSQKANPVSAVRAVNVRSWGRAGIRGMRGGRSGDRAPSLMARHSDPRDSPPPAPNGAAAATDLVLLLGDMTDAATPDVVRPHGVNQLGELTARAPSPRGQTERRLSSQPPVAEVRPGHPHPMQDDCKPAR